MNMTPPKYELVIQDCEEAVALDKKYVKAINRRGIAFENLERYEEAIRGGLVEL
jgi:mitochondrial import receptor subunit TOM70